MKDKILIIVPTKQRLNDFIIFADSYIDTTSGLSDVVVGIDDSDDTYDGIMDKYPFIWEKNEPMKVLKYVNHLANKYVDEYKYVAFIEDDCKFITKGFEEIFINKMNEIGKNAIVWGNDLLNGGSIVGIPFMDYSIVKRLGYITPPQIEFLFPDHFWKRLGDSLNSLCYFGDVIIEHRHYSTGKREKDTVSEVVDANGLNDMHGYNSYIQNGAFNNDLLKLQ
jgi:hypothetical protein